MKDEEAADLFGALSNADRLKVIRALVEAGPSGMTAGTLAEKINASPSRASFHLSALFEAGFILRERRSRSLVYQVDFVRIAALLNFLMEGCCMGDDTLKSCCNF